MYSKILSFSLFLLSSIIIAHSIEDTEQCRTSSPSDFRAERRIQDKEIILQFAHGLSFDLLNDKNKRDRKQSLALLYPLLSGGRSLKQEGFLNFQDLRGKISTSEPVPADNLGATFTLDGRLEIAEILLGQIMKAEKKRNLTYLTSTVNLLTLAFADSSDEKVFDFFLNAYKKVENDKACRTLKKTLKAM